MSSLLVFLADAWGTRFGGINSFNFDLAGALAKSLVGRRLEVLCVITTDATQEGLEYARECGVRLITARGANPTGLGAEDAEALVQAVTRDARRSRVLWWIGHDTVTGGAAVRAAQLGGGQCAVIHHMSYIDYMSYKHGVGRFAQEKFELQKRVFSGAGQVL